MPVNVYGYCMLKDAHGAKLLPLKHVMHDGIENASRACAFLRYGEVDLETHSYIVVQDRLVEKKK